MAYSIGQIRRNQISSFSVNVNYNLSLLVNKDSIVDFYNPYIYMSNTLLSFAYSYYLRFKVKQRTDSTQDFSIKLANSDSTDKNTQSVRTFNVKSGNDYTTFELIFTPNSAYNEIIFELRRLALDFNLVNDNGKNGRIMDIEILDFYIVNNIITDYLQSHFSDLKQLKKIGIQGPPGLLFALNGEEIRIGKSGVYELCHDSISISYLGFCIKESNQVPDGKDFFILDFKY
jgi:hypothetical protein